jgi:hypothetical protein
MSNLFQSPFNPLSDFKNPCWMSTLGLSNPYQNHSGIPRRDLSEKYKSHMRQIYNKRIHNGTTWRLRCFPYAMLIGVSKSGTTDLFWRIMKHPMIFPCATKEPWFWVRHRMQCTYGMTLCNISWVRLSHHTCMLDYNITSHVHTGSMFISHVHTGSIFISHVHTGSIFISHVCTG